MRELREIDRAECLRLLAATRFGRLAVDMSGQPPLIRPVNYIFDEAAESVTFRTAAGSKHHALLAAHKASFEIDGLDQENRIGWSVVVRGAAEEITDPRELRRLATAPLDPWAPGEKAHWMRIRAWTVTGRRIAQPESAAGDSVVNRSAAAAPLG